MSPKVNRLDLAPPADVVAGARSVMGGIDLDPYSTPLVNRLVLATRIYDRDQEDINDVVAREWIAAGERRLLLAPPYGAGATRRLMNKTLREYRTGRIREALIWIGSNECLTRTPWAWDFPICMPFRRLRPCYYDDELEEFRSICPSDWSLVVYLPPSETGDIFHSRLSRFHVTFAPIGRVIFNQYSGEDDWEDAYRVTYKRPYNYRD